jgi:hypothetical protein
MLFATNEMHFAYGTIERRHIKIPADTSSGPKILMPES